MSDVPELVLAGSSPLSEDELSLPRPPGVIRRFWARHPLFADILIAILALVFTLPGAALRAPAPEPVAPWTAWMALGLTVLGCAALVWRRRWPVPVFALALLPSLAVADSDLNGAVSGPAALIALYSVAVYRGARTCWIAFGVAGAISVAFGAARMLVDPAGFAAHLSVTISTIVGLLIGALIGVNVGNRRRYLLALIDRSRQLLVERDQQARLAAAAERSRIAREMHDIVSHSLTVVVALAEGAAATRDPERSAEATRAIADTAREALAEMRVMLGVLRDEDADAPLAPVADATAADVVAAARAAGAPATLSITGVPDAPPIVRLAVLRVVREGLTNALRYTRDPSYIRVALVYRPDEIEVSVENDGARADAPSQGAGMGLRGLEERVAHLNGTISAGMVADAVWRLRVVVPTKEQPGE
ncbi:sensor histidine kinase [Microbacterium sp. CFBP9034]|uniref:sensor histidine kinase n=1 Tax=Microbacterium sp. CFBP9034 TaxID=3096540 RepID=UPI002A6AAE28|nr:histidine kinase [Microbacterium sp. CFBP9034]MDY0909572.1 histidine kinase [Microbacterium sp. CFBP9034]